jgi:hypothetical protein
MQRQRALTVYADGWALHALGWSRREALEFVVAHVPNPEPFLANEIDSGSLPMPVLEDKLRRWAGDDGEPTSL